mmetsp:Transcript_6832/g.16767  ORF Transcript_6832/g.16767 Transcript_6832/m.16767 type:complete len:437 (-) Transcript_6832:11-1321(-)
MQNRLFLKRQQYQRSIAFTFATDESRSGDKNPEDAICLKDDARTRRTPSFVRAHEEPLNFRCSPIQFFTKRGMTVLSTPSKRREMDPDRAFTHARTHGARWRERDASVESRASSRRSLDEDRGSDRFRFVLAGVEDLPVLDPFQVVRQRQASGLVDGHAVGRHPVRHQGVLAFLVGPVVDPHPQPDELAQGHHDHVEDAYPLVRIRAQVVPHRPGRDAEGDAHDLSGQRPVEAPVQVVHFESQHTLRVFGAVELVQGDAPDLVSDGDDALHLVDGILQYGHPDVPQRPEHVVDGLVLHRRVPAEQDRPARGVPPFQDLEAARFERLHVVIAQVVEDDVPHELVLPEEPQLGLEVPGQPLGGLLHVPLGRPQKHEPEGGVADVRGVLRERQPVGLVRHQGLELRRRRRDGYRRGGSLQAPLAGGGRLLRGPLRLGLF